jgi:hypothetical protein
VFSRVQTGPAIPWGCDTLPRRLDSRLNRPVGQRQEPSRWATADSDVPQLGLDLSAVDNPIESGILNVCQRMHSGRLKVFASLSKYLGRAQALSPSYRRATKPSGQLVLVHTGPIMGVHVHSGNLVP